MDPEARDRLKRSIDGWTLIIAGLAIFVGIAVMTYVDRPDGVSLDGITLLDLLGCAFGGLLAYFGWRIKP